MSVLSSTRILNRLEFTAFIHQVKYLGRLDAFERVASTFETSVESLNDNRFNLRMLTHSQYEVARRAYEDAILQSATQRAKSNLLTK